MGNGLVVDEDGLHGPEVGEGSIFLQSGYYPITVMGVCASERARALYCILMYTVRLSPKMFDFFFFGCFVVVSFFFWGGCCGWG